MNIISRKDALAEGSTYYFTGKPCKYGHITKRLTSNWTCYECSLIQHRNVPKHIKALSDKKYRDSHKEELKLSKRAYYLRTRKIIEITPEQRKLRKELSALAQTVRHRVQKAVKRKGYKKTSSTMQILGCSWEDLKEHLENQFTDGMSWDNHTYEGWHIDHIIPLASAKTAEELFKLGHYTNLQPLWKEDNLSKGCRILK